MKIADYALSMQSSHSRTEQTSVKESLRIWADRPAPSSPPPASQVSISPSAHHAAAIDNAMREAENDPGLQLLMLMIEKLTGHKVKVFDPSQLGSPDTPAVADPHAAAHQEAQSAPRAGYGLDYSKVESYSVSEQTTLQASGIIKTSDGKEISFDLNLSMQYQYSETSSTSLRLGDAARKSDPLVINFNGTAAQLSEQRFAFDLNSDGAANEQISFVQPGSGFLALDKNGDGKINNGSELFGPGTGNGFTELAQYDDDRNGWIDENDAVFQQLKVWSKDASGSNQLDSLAARGVGALSLQSIATPFDIKTATNQLLGSVRSTSVALNENGSVGSLQQIDLVV